MEGSRKRLVPIFQLCPRSTLCSQRDDDPESRVHFGLVSCGPQGKFAIPHWASDALPAGGRACCDSWSFSSRMSFQGQILGVVGQDRSRLVDHHSSPAKDDGALHIQSYARQMPDPEVSPVCKDIVRLRRGRRSSYHSRTMEIVIMERRGKAT